MKYEYEGRSLTPHYDQPFDCLMEVKLSCIDCCHACKHHACVLLLHAGLTTNGVYFVFIPSLCVLFSMLVFPSWVCHCAFYILSKAKVYNDLAVSWSLSRHCECVCVCVWHSCFGWLWLCGARIQRAVVDCCFFCFFSPFSCDDTHFHLLPFSLRFLWLELTVLATANCPSTWLKCDREEEAENEIWSLNGMGEG